MIEKCWGKTKEVVCSEFYSRHELQLIQYGYCSIHYHQSRANRFIIEKGLVEVIEFYGPKCKRLILGPDNVHDVPSLVPHMFLVHEAGTMIEEYYADRGGSVDKNDIIRFVQGGMSSASELQNLPYNLIDQINE